MWTSEQFAQYATGEHIRLREARLEDADAMASAIVPDATRNLLYFAEPVNIVRQRLYIAQMIESRVDLLLVIERKSDGVMLGTIGFHEFDPRCMNARLGILIFRPEDRSRGYATEAIRLLLAYMFRALNLEKVYLQVFTTNTIGRAYYAKRGFVEEGIMRHEYFLNGTFHDMVRMSILHGEWEEKYGSATRA